MLRLVGRDARGLPSGWDTPIPDAIWPEAMLSAIRHDITALASPRVIATLQRWRADAADPSRPEAAKEAIQLLNALGRALLPSEDPIPEDVFDTEGVATTPPQTAFVERPEPPSDDHTVDSFQLPPKPRGLRRAAPVEPDFDAPETVFADDAIVAEAPSDTDSRVLRHVGPVTTGASAPPTSGFSEEDEKPTTAFLRPETASREAPPPPPPPPPIPTRDASVRASSWGATIVPEIEPQDSRTVPFDDDDKPTRHIDLPEARRRVASAAEVALPSPPEDATEAFADDDAPERKTGELDRDLGAEDRHHSRLAPKPGVIRRRSGRSRPRDATSPRPRAAMHHVRALYGILVPFASELIPLPFERRSRRFWARWREVAGDRGVRREFVEELLRSTADTRTLVCELISEVQSVDLKSVYALVDKLGEIEIVDVAPGAPDRTRGPLVGASVRVEGVLVDEADS